MKIQIFLSSFFLAVFLTTGLFAADVEKTFQVKKGGTLEVTVTGEVIIQTSSQDEVYIKAKGIPSDAMDELEMSLNDNTVSIVFDSHRSYHTPSFEIRIPEQFNANLKTAGGDIRLKNYLKGNIYGKTAGGDISTQNVDGKVEMKTAGGSIKIGDVSGELKLTTAGGDINVNNATENATLITAGGDIEINNVGKTLTVKNTGGNIKVGNVGGEFKASTLGGNIDGANAESNAKLTTSGGDIELQAGNGYIEAVTSGGDIKLTKIHGALKAVTSGGEVSAELFPEGKSDSKLVSAGGDVTLYIPENASVTIEAEIRVHGSDRGNYRLYSDSKEGESSSYKINSDFKSDKYAYDENSGKIKATYTLNGGGKYVKIATAESNIFIKKAGK